VAKRLLGPVSPIFIARSPVKQSDTGSRGHENSGFPVHSKLPRIYLFSILFLTALSSVGEVRQKLVLTSGQNPKRLSADVWRSSKQTKIVTNLPAGTVGVSYSGSVSINGNSSTYQFSVSAGALPTGLTLNPKTGAVIGTPTSAATSYFELMALSTNGPLAVAQSQITISGVPVSAVSVTISPLSSVVQSGGNLQFQAAVQGTSNTSVVWSAGAGSISSTGLFTAPSVTSSTTVNVTATSVANSTKQATATVSVAQTVSPLAITTSSLAPATAGTSYITTLSGTGGAVPYKWSIGSGALPSGVQLNSTTGVVGGVPANSGSFPFSAVLTDAVGQTSQHSLMLTVNASTSSGSPTSSGTCGPPAYNCSRSDSSFVPVPSTIPSWGGLIGTNTVVNDPDFHNPIVRVTDASLGVTQGYCTGLGGSGDVPQVWNADSTMLLICDGNGQYFPIGFDPTNFKSLGPIYGTTPSFYISGPGLFSHTDPNKFYALNRSQLQTIDYSDRTTRPTPQLLYDFRNCGVATVGYSNIGGSDPNDTIFGMTFSLTQNQGTGYYVTVYNSSTNVCYNLNTATGVVTQYPGGTVIGTVNLPDRFYIHNVKMKGGNTIVVVAQLSGCLSTCSNGPYAWVIGTTQMLPLGNPMGGGHWAAGCGKWLNQPGNLYQYNVTRDYLNPTLWNSVWSVSSSQCGAAPLMSCVQPFDSHPAWLGDCSDTGPVCMATAVSTDVVQYPYQNEIVCITTDGSNRQIRFSHTYSSVALKGFDAQWSIGGPSQDGRFYAWTTKAGGQFGCTDNTFNCALTSRRTDVLVVKLR
jgi:hypothetical protein